VTTLARAYAPFDPPAPSRGGSGTESFADQLLLRAFRGMRGAVGLAVSDSSSGTLAYLIVDSYDLEDEAYERFGKARRNIGDYALNLVCIDRAAADRLHLSEGARTYPLG
jgi:hypothetical protein